MPASSLLTSFEAGAFHPDYGTRRVAGTLRLDGGMVTFEGGQGSFAFPLEGVQVRQGGASDRLVFFEHPAVPKASIFTADLAVLNHPAFAHNPTLTRERDRIHRRRFVSRSLVLAVLGLIVAAIAGLWLAKDSMVRAIARKVPAAWEQKLGDAAFTHFSLGKKLVTDDVVMPQLEQLAAPLLAVVPQDRYSFKLHIVEDASFNAFALPGGNVVFHTGLLLAADTPEEVLGVLAHELSHVTHQHGVQGIIQSLGLYAIVSFFVGDVSGVAAILVNNAPFLLTQKFSRDHEREADEQGFRYLEAAKLDPQGMIVFFEKMQREEAKLKEQIPGGEALGALTFLSTHPATADRAARLEQLLAQSPRKDGFTEVELNFRAFQETLRAKLSLPDRQQTNQPPASKPE